MLAVKTCKITSKSQTCWITHSYKGEITDGGDGSFKMSMGLGKDLTGSCYRLHHKMDEHGNKHRRARHLDSPYCWWLGPLHLQVIVLFLRLEVCKNYGDGVSGISKYGPRTVRTIVIFTREIGTRNDAT